MNDIRCAKLFEIIDRLENEYINFWIDICNIESPTEYKEGVDRVSAYIIGKARQHGWQVEVQPQPVSGDCVCITMNPESKEQSVCFSGHMDTVHAVGSFGETPVRCDDEKIYGPGVTDCKGGIVASFFAMAALESVGFTARPVKLILQSDEEVSSRYSNKTTIDFMAKCAENCIAFFNGEGHTPGRAVIARKGISRYSIEVTGKAEHASACYNGRSAILEAAHKIIELEKLKDDKKLTCNCGLISGGTAENTVPDKCTFTADIRFRNEAAMLEADELVNKVAQTSYIGDTTAAVTLRSRRCAMELSDCNLELLDRLNKILSENNLQTLERNFSAGGSDAADMTSRGIPCLDSLGVRGGKIHNINEYAYLSSLKESAKMLAAAAYCI